MEATEFGRHDDDGAPEDDDSQSMTIDEEPAELLEVLISQQVSGLLEEVDDLDDLDDKAPPSRSCTCSSGGRSRRPRLCCPFATLEDRSRRIESTISIGVVAARQRHRLPDVEAQKSQPSCWDCGNTGHWGGDATRAKPGAGLCRPARGDAKGGGRGRGSSGVLAGCGGSRSVKPMDFDVRVVEREEEPAPT